MLTRSSERIFNPSRYTGRISFPTEIFKKISHTPAREAHVYRHHWINSKGTLNHQFITVLRYQVSLWHTAAKSSTPLGMGVLDMAPGCHMA